MFEIREGIEYPLWGGSESVEIALKCVMWIGTCETFFYMDIDKVLGCFFEETNMLSFIV